MSQGVPMVLGGDELGRTQRGNNNAYCQDNEVSWYDWEHVDTELLAFTRRLIALRRQHPAFRRRRFFEGRSVFGGDLADIGWFNPDGSTMGEADWEHAHQRSLTVFLNGRELPSPGPRGERVQDSSFLLLFNADPEQRVFVIPASVDGMRWEVCLDTADPSAGGADPGDTCVVAPWSLMVLVQLDDRSDD